MKRPNTAKKAAPAAKTTSQTLMPGERPAEADPTFDEIRKRAFEIHVERGGIHGFDLDDWLQAESELKKK